MSRGTLGVPRIPGSAFGWHPRCLLAPRRIGPEHPVGCVGRIEWTARSARPSRRRGSLVPRFVDRPQVGPRTASGSEPDRAERGTGSLGLGVRRWSYNHVVGLPHGSPLPHSPPALCPKPPTKSRHPKPPTSIRRGSTTTYVRYAQCKSHHLYPFRMVLCVPWLVSARAVAPRSSGVESVLAGFPSSTGSPTEAATGPGRSSRTRKLG